MPSFQPKKAGEASVVSLREGTAIAPPPPHAVQTTWRVAIERALEELRYGSIELVVHDGQVVQIVRTERIRFDR